LSLPQLDIELLLNRLLILLVVFPNANVAEEAVYSVDEDRQADAEKQMATFADMTTWTDRLGHTGLRSFTDTDGHFWLEQNPAKQSKWAKLARAGHAMAWEFVSPGGSYTGRLLIDGTIYTTREATKKFLPRTDKSR
jgi:hypothetical protein